MDPLEGPEIFDYNDTIISQFANSPIILALIGSFSSAVNPLPLLTQFYDLLWNVDTASGYGLDVWGRIVGVTRQLKVATGVFLGFEGSAGASGDSFNAAPFYAGQSITDNFSLTDQSFRTLIIAKALANISDGSIPSINQILRTLFPGRGNCYVSDDGNMHLTYTFKFKLSPAEESIVAQSGVLPKSVGVTAAVSTP